MEKNHAVVSLESRKMIHTVLYGWIKEKDILDAFIQNLYTDRSGSVLRADVHLFTVLAYISLYQLSVIGTSQYTILLRCQDPCKMKSFCTYLFDPTVLYSCLRSDWMRLRDIAYVEKNLIEEIEKNTPNLRPVFADIEQKAGGSQSAVIPSNSSPIKRLPGLTKPQSPRISAPRPRRRPPLEEYSFSNPIVDRAVPDFSRTSLEALEEMSKKRLEATREATEAKYKDTVLGHFIEKIDTSAVEALRVESNARDDAQLAFNSKFCHPPPDFSLAPPAVRVNAASILREDSLCKKQQAKDAALLKTYEAELRDGFEYFSWQHDMKTMDAAAALAQVEFRREQAKQSAEDAREAIARARADNQAVAELLRQQGKAIREQKALEDEIEAMRNRELAAAVIEVRTNRPKMAKEELRCEREESARALRCALEDARTQREAELAEEEARRVERTRELKAINSVSKKHVVVFDPTEIAGEVFLDEMSMLEMKERLALDKTRADAIEAARRESIVEEKRLRVVMLEDKAAGVLRARQARAEAKNRRRLSVQERSLEDERQMRLARDKSAEKLSRELAEKHAAREVERERRRAEEERALRMMEFSGSSTAVVQESRIVQVEMAKERQAAAINEGEARRIEKQNAAKKSDMMNKIRLGRREVSARTQESLRRETEMLRERREAADRARDDILRKKALNIMGSLQHKRTVETTIALNPYAHDISKADVNYGKHFVKAKTTSRTRSA